MATVLAPLDFFNPYVLTYYICIILLCLGYNLVIFESRGRDAVGL